MQVRDDGVSPGNDIPADSLHVDSDLSKMAVYGCVTWGYGVLRQPDGTYVVTRWLMGQTTSNDDTELVISAAGGPPSDEFKNALESFYRFDPPLNTFP